MKIGPGGVVSYATYGILGGTEEGKYMRRGGGGSPAVVRVDLDVLSVHCRCREDADEAHKVQRLFLHDLFSRISNKQAEGHKHCVTVSI